MPAPVENCVPYTIHSNYAEILYDGATKTITLYANIAKNTNEKASHHWEYHTKQINLNTLLGYHNGKLVWDHEAGFDDLDIKGVELIGKRILTIHYEDTDDSSDVLERSISIDLSQRLTIENGDLKYVGHGTQYPKTSGMPGFITDPLKDGNIRPSAFTIASDPIQDRCRIAYKTQIDDKVSMAEVLFEHGHWFEPQEIVTWASKMPGDNFALVFDPANKYHDSASTKLDQDVRHLFFSEPDGDGYIYQQTCTNNVWAKPRKPRDLQGREMAIKAHRFSGFAATCDYVNELILFYFIDESNALLEYAGKYYGPDPSGRIPEGYRWTRTEVLCENMTLRQHIAAVSKQGKTFVVYRSPDHDLCMTVGRARSNWETRLKRNDKCGEATWETFVIRDKSQLAKDSPLAVAVGSLEAAPKVFYLHKDRKTETIMALDIKKGVASYEFLKAVPVGKLEPGSDIAAASLPATQHRYNIRVYSVSKMDGDNILVERIQRRVRDTEGAQQVWCLSGGVVDTDVDHIRNPISARGEHARTDDD